MGIGHFKVQSAVDITMMASRMPERDGM